MCWWAIRNAIASRHRRALSAATRLWSRARNATVASTRRNAKTIAAIRVSSASTISRSTPVRRAASVVPRRNARRHRVPAVWPTRVPLCPPTSIRSARRKRSAAGRAHAMAPRPSAQSPGIVTTRPCATMAPPCAYVANAADHPVCYGI